MSDSEGGGVFGAILVAIIILLILAVIAVSFWGSPEGIEELPDFAEGLMSGVIGVATPIVNTIYFIVVPSDLANEDAGMIAFAIFLLIGLIGIKTLEPFFKNRALSFVIALVVGLIASRSVNEVILDDIALGAAPLAGVSLFVTFAVLIGISNFVEKTGMTQYMKLGLMGLVSVIIWIFYTLVFEAQLLGWVYGIGALFYALAQTVLPHFKKTLNQRTNENLGRYMAGVHNDITIVKDMKTGSESS